LVSVEISSNGSDFVSVGQTTGQCGFIDIDAFGFGPGDQFFFVRVTDIFADQFRENSSAGAEINAIGAITTAVLDPPNAQNDNYSTDEDTPLSVGAGEGLLDNDSDPNGEDITVVDFTQPANGTVTVNPNGSFDYTPDPDFAGTDTFEYTIENESGLRDTATVTIEVIDLPPIARNDEYTTDEDTPLSVNEAEGLLANDETPNPPFEVIDNTDPDNGEVTVDSDGSFEYTPDPGFNGVDTFEYTAEDADDDTDPATVRITVEPVGDLPNARDDEYETDQNTTLTVNAGNGVLANDDSGVGDIAVVDFTEPMAGTLTLNPDGSFEYSPNPGFAGTDIFEYTIENDDGERDTATVTITVNAENEPPSARDDEGETTQGDPVKIDVLRNDDDPDGDSLEITDVTQPDGGTVEITDDGQIRFTPDPGFTGHTRFTYTIDDGNGGTDTAEVVINVQEKNDPPKAEDDRYDAKQDQPKDVDNPGVLKNDEDPEGNNLTASIDEQPDNGHVDMKDNGGFAYTPDPGFHGADEFTYWVKDGHGNRSKGRVKIRVEQAKGDEPGLAVSGDGGVSSTNADGGAVAVDEAVLDDPASDSDGDGLSFEEERKAYGTDPWAWDSDGDGLGDGDEILVNGTDPLAPEPTAAEQPVSPVEAAPVAEVVIDPALTEVPPAEVAVDLPLSEASAVEAVVDSAVTPDAANPAAALALGCAAFPGWLDAQSAYEAAGRTGTDPAIVNTIDSDWDGIACEELMP
jgi:hypothetical protein